eukprot:4505234-Pyramimonas_sp.AAC.1
MAWQGERARADRGGSNDERVTELAQAGAGSGLHPPLRGSASTCHGPLSDCFGATTAPEEGAPGATEVAHVPS